MRQRILVNATSGETRVALLENGQVAEIYIDRPRGSRVGNVYKGRVVKVLPGMQAAFVDIGGEKSAFLYVGDVETPAEDYAQILEEAETNEAGVEVEPPRRRRLPSQPIEALLQEGQEILVQVSKEPIGTKGARVTTYISLPGRYLVYMPTVDHVGISRRVEDEAERRRLRELILAIRPPGAGYIVRTAGEGMGEEAFRRDMAYLERVWSEIPLRQHRHTAPILLHRDLDLASRILRDLFTPEVGQMLVDDPDAYQQARSFAETYFPDLADRIQPYEETEPIFDAFGVEREIGRALSRKVWLKSGGSIVIDQTEALTSIDVNTGRYVGRRNLEDTILKTNLEAAVEIAAQLRLRNIGGIIIIDFIDMEVTENRQVVFTALQEALVGDRARSHIEQISELGLVQMTRKRVRESLGRTLCEPCPCCEGRGTVKSAITVCHEIFREITRASATGQERKVVVHAHPNVADLLYDEEREAVAALELACQKKIIIKSDTSLLREQFEVVVL